MTAAAAITRAAATMIAGAEQSQSGSELRPQDFFALAQAAEQVLDAIYALNATLGRQLARTTPDQLQPGASRTPEQILEAAGKYGETLHTALRQARRAAGQLASEFAGTAFLPSAGGAVATPVSAQPAGLATPRRDQPGQIAGASPAR